MRFRPPLGRKWFFPFILCGLILLGVGLLQVGVEMFPKGLGDLIEHASALLLFVVIIVLTFVGCAAISWEVWTSRVDLDEEGVRWKAGSDEGVLRWEEISSLALEKKKVRLVERSPGRSRLLPFISRKLYEALILRVTPLPPEKEEILFPSRRY